MSDYSDSSNYGYTPSLGWSSTYVALFALAAIVHSVLAYKSKYWLIFPTLVLGSLIEVMGWSARIWSGLNVLYVTPFLMQICTLIMAPVFYSAYDYAILGVAIKKLGPEYSVLRPSWYLIVFLVADTVSLILQAVGGGQAASSAADSAPTDSATNIMVAGIIFQLVTMAIFMVLGVDFVVRRTMKKPYQFQLRRLQARAEAAAAAGASVGAGGEGLVHRNSETTIVTNDVEAATAGKEHTGDSEDRDRAGTALPGNWTQTKLQARWWIFLIAVAISSLMIIVRGVFRSIELSNGWSSTLATTELYQTLLDGLPMLIAVWVYVPFHPYFLLPQRESWRGIQ